MKPKKEIKIVAGKWIEMGSNENIACCDCGLVHRVEYKVKIKNNKPEKFYVRFWRNEKLTLKQKYDQI